MQKSHQMALMAAAQDIYSPKKSGSEFAGA
jgi:hypothetical protein